MVFESTLFSSTPSLPMDVTLTLAHGAVVPANIISWPVDRCTHMNWGGREGGRGKWKGQSRRKRKSDLNICKLAHKTFNCACKS